MSEEEYSPVSDGDVDTVAPDRALNETDEEYTCCNCHKTNHFVYCDDRDEIDCPECNHRREDECCEEA
ncbi:hypothetical protein SLS62_003367 [Diatrype stigma]|uniref:Uncharacterized protein n=1 Tax=Diatrype stigma TaxID=117547 RepID=A0AAN9USI1_9PEZI